jgi:hypothetical protein
MNTIKQELLKLIETLDESQQLYVYTLLEKLFGSH